jgi:hypothetical protein
VLGLPKQSPFALQVIFGEGAFLLKNIGESSTDPVSFVAGVESAVRAYENAKKTNQDFHIEVLEEALGQRSNGRLGEWTEARFKERCHQQFY